MSLNFYYYSNSLVFQAVPTEPWESPDSVASGHSSPWTRPLRRGASVLDLGGAPPGCAGCAHCGPVQWRYGSCASLDHQWPAGWPPQGCCMPHPHDPHMRHPHLHPSQTPQPYRRGMELKLVAFINSKE